MPPTGEAHGLVVWVCGVGVRWGVGWGGAGGGGGEQRRPCTSPNTHRCRLPLTAPTITPPAHTHTHTHTHCHPRRLDAEWHHLAVTWWWESGEVCVYLDGKQQTPYWASRAGEVEVG